MMHEDELWNASLGADDCAHRWDFANPDPRGEHEVLAYACSACGELRALWLDAEGGPAEVVS